MPTGKLLKTFPFRSFKGSEPTQEELRRELEEVYKYLAKQWAEIELPKDGVDGAPGAPGADGASASYQAWRTRNAATSAKLPHGSLITDYATERLTLAYLIPNLTGDVVAGNTYRFRVRTVVKGYHGATIDVTNLRVLDSVYAGVVGVEGGAIASLAMTTNCFFDATTRHYNVAGGQLSTFIRSIPVVVGGNVVCQTAFVDYSGISMQVVDVILEGTVIFATSGTMGISILARCNSSSGLNYWFTVGDSQMVLEKLD